MPRSLVIFPYFIIFVLFLTLGASSTRAATLFGVSDTITTSRPSPSTPLSADVAGGAGSASVYNNGSTFLASDSARLWGQTAENVTIATASADKQTVFFTTNAVNPHANGTVIAAAITAVHTIKFTTIGPIPTSGTIVITFPPSNSSDTNQASPSAATFMFNGLASANIKTNNVTATCVPSGTGAGQVPTITCTNTGSSVSGGTTLTLLLGCTTAGTSCIPGNQIPTIINPTKSAANGVADRWLIKINTFDASSNPIDSGQTRIGTIESVNVYAHIDPTFTFQIFGLPGGTVLNTLCTSNPDTTDTDFGTTPNEVNLGTLSAAATAHKAQKMTITSNAISGYTVTATSSGHLINPANGYYIQDAQGSPTNNDAPGPASIGNGGNQFGIHPCDLNGKVSTGTWGTASPLYANPSQSFYYTLINSSTGPAVNGGDTFVVEYGASPGGGIPPGDYRTTLTYVATSIF